MEIKFTEDFIHDKSINVYRYGSIVYGTTTSNSDEDFIVVMPNYFNCLSDSIKVNGKDYSCYTENDFIEGIRQHKIHFLECLFLDDKNIIKKSKDYEFALDKIQLRRSISAVVDNAYDKSKKKMTIEKDYDLYIAKKSLWHAFRISFFAIQIATHGKIVNYQEGNEYFNEIMNMNTSDWNSYKERFHTRALHLRSEFQKLCPKL